MQVLVRQRAGEKSAVCLVDDAPAAQGERGARIGPAGWEVGIADGPGWLACSVFLSERAYHADEQIRIDGAGT